MRCVQTSTLGQNLALLLAVFTMLLCGLAAAPAGAQQTADTSYNLGLLQVRQRQAFIEGRRQLGQLRFLVGQSALAFARGDRLQHQLGGGRKSRTAIADRPVRAIRCGTMQLRCLAVSKTVEFSEAGNG